MSTDILIWEYLELNNPSLTDLRDAGKSGWELIWTDGSRHLFKRPKK